MNFPICELKKKADNFKLNMKKVMLKRQIKKTRRNNVIVKETETPICEWRLKFSYFEQVLQQEKNNRNVDKLIRLLTQIRKSLSLIDNTEANITELLFDMNSSLIDILIEIILEENLAKEEVILAEIFWIFSVVSAVERQYLIKFLNLNILDLMRLFMECNYEPIIDSVMWAIANILIEIPESIEEIHNLKIFAAVTCKFNFIKKDQEILKTFIWLSNIISDSNVKTKEILDLFLDKIFTLIKENNKIENLEIGNFLNNCLNYDFKEFLNLNIEKEILNLLKNTTNEDNIKDYCQILFFYSTQNKICDKFYDINLPDILLTKSFHNNNTIKKYIFQIIQNLILSKSKFIKLLLKSDIIERIYSCIENSNDLFIKFTVFECLNTFVFVSSCNKKFFDFLIKKHILDFPFQFLNHQNNRLVLIALDLIEKLLFNGNSLRSDENEKNFVLVYFEENYLKEKFECLLEHKNDEIFQFAQSIESTYF